MTRVKNTSLLQGKFVGNVWDDGVVIKLFIQFLKKHHCMHNLYGTLSRRGLLSNDKLTMIMAYPSIGDMGLLFLRYAKKENLKTGEIKQGDLVLSQLWKFYLLERINQFPIQTQQFIESILKGSILNNGYRDSEEVKKLFVEHNFKSRYEI
jgi:hypothetical protein